VSNNDYTRHLVAPTGRSISRIRQDAKRLGVPLDEMGAKHGIDLPWVGFIDVLKDRDELAFDAHVIDLYPKAELLPRHGTTDFLIGVPGSNIRQSAAMVLMIASKVRKNESIGYTDFAVSAKNKPPAASNFERNPKNKETDEAKKQLAHLKLLSATWEQAFQYVRSQDGQFMSVKVPQHLRFKDQQNTSTVVAYNPRKFAFSRLLPILEKGAVLVADSQAKSIMDLGSSKHWQQLNEPRCAEDRRKVLAATGTISEQRCVLADNKRVLLRRSVVVSDFDKSQLLDISVSIKATLESIEQRMQPWSEAVHDLISNNDLSLATSEALTRKAALLDNVTLAYATPAPSPSM